MLPEEFKKIEEIAKKPLKDEKEIKMVEICLLKYKDPEVETKALQHIIENTNYPFKLTVYDNRVNSPNTSKIWNRLIKESTCDYVCILDSDVFVSRDWLKRMMETFEKPDCYVVLPVMNKTSGQEQIAKGALPYPQEPVKAKQIFAGQLVLYKKEIFDKIGYFDEDFNIYGQDSEWAYRLLKSEYNAYIRPDVWVEHIGGYSLRKSADNKEYDRRLEKSYAKILFKNKTYGKS